MIISTFDFEFYGLAHLLVELSKIRMIPVRLFSRKFNWKVDLLSEIKVKQGRNKVVPSAEVISGARIIFISGIQELLQNSWGSQHEFTGVQKNVRFSFYASHGSGGLTWYYESSNLLE